MACFHPLFAYKVKGIKTKNNKDLIKIIPKTDLNVVNDDGVLRFYLPKTVNSDDIEATQLPCGNCVGCRLEYSRQWAVRIMLEAQSYEHNYFLTLTYDDDHLPVRSYYSIDTNTGELLPYESYSATLVKSDLQQFFKKLRRYYKYHYDTDNIRFFACGEYGDINRRPHYHPIIFNLPIKDLKLCSESSKSGFKLYESETISMIWNKGLVRIAELNFDTACYTARYVMKKHKGNDSNYYNMNGLDPEFVLMSRRPGIGRDFFDKNKHSIYSSDSIFMPASDGVIKLKPVKYFDRLYDIDYPSDLEVIKAKRREANSLREASLATDKPDYLYRGVLENYKLLSSKALVRDL